MIILLYGFWLILNGKITPEILITGAVLMAAIALFSHLLFGWTPKKDLRNLRRLPFAAAYLAVLLVEIIRANLAVARLIFRGEKKLSPVLVTFETDLRTDTARYILANSITLTPGTITVEAEGSVFSVHCLAEELLDATDANIFVRLLKKMEA